MKVLVSLVLFACILFFATQSAQAQSFECDFCTFAVNYIEGYLKENRTQAEIISYLKATCAYAPSYLVTPCLTFVNNEVPGLIDYIIRTESPETACAALDICSAQTLISKAKLSLTKPAAVQKQK